MKISTKLTNYLKNLTGIRVSPNSDIRQGVQAFTTVFLGLLTSFGLGFLVNDSAYATYSASISRTSSGTITLSDSSGGSIKPSSTGTLGTGSDVVTVSSNCSAGYNLYVSAISGGSTNLSTSGGLDYIPSTTTATGSEAALAKDTWGIGKDGVTFSKLPAYTVDIGSITPLYTGAGSISSPNKEYTIYYGANISTAKTPGTYSGDVLYTVLMTNACLEYTLKFDDNGATTSNLPDQTISFGQAVDLSEYSTTDKISKTGYHLSGWKIKDGDGTLLPTNNNTSLDDGESSELTLIAEWEANTYTVKYAAGNTGGSCSVSDTPATYDQNVTLSSTKCTKSGAEQKGWSTTNSATNTKTYDFGQTLVKPNLTSTNGGSVTLYPYFEANMTISSLTYMQDMTSDICNNSSIGENKVLSDKRDSNSYRVNKLKDGKCWMVENLRISDMELDSTTSDLAVGTKFTVPKSTNEAFTASNAGTVAKMALSTDTTNARAYGGYYNFVAATAGTGSGYNVGTTSGIYSICPKGWTLPTKDQFVALDKAFGYSGEYRSGGTEQWNASYGNTNYSGGYPGFVKSGIYYKNSQEAVYVGQETQRWSSVAYSATAAYTLLFRVGTHLNPFHDNEKFVGSSVNCIAR